MKGDSIFGVEPTRLKKLAALGLGSDSEQNDGPATSNDLFVEKEGHWIGPYHLQEVLGEGGMGIVYQAEQIRPIRRQVAVKLVKPGMDSRKVIARFEAEQQALALMDHPHIARVYDAGLTPSGRPYFVMEHVEGIPITAYCDELKLTIEKRLELFLRVCDAVQHAHQKGIIHRDIKPSNILVSKRDHQAAPRIIDFGIAKALTDPLTERTLQTEQGQFVGTPEYMSPEQAEPTNQGIDTRTDIYSLGVVLYELMAGVLPFDADTLREGGPEHIRRVIREEDPKTPSTRLSTASGEESTKVAATRQTDIHTLGRRLHGDLDWITLKAMEKNPDRRYATAHALAEDIRRHLNHEPITAGSPSLTYRLSKFLRRNRTRVTAGAGVIVLLGCVSALTITSSRASRQAQAAATLRDRETLQTAQEAFSERRFTHALDLIVPIVNSESVGAKAQLLQANILMEGGHPKEAETILTKLVNEEPHIAGAAHSLLARIHWEGSHIESDTLEQAAYHREEAEKLLPETADAFYLGALTALTVKETMQKLDKALTLDPTHYPSRRLHASTLWASQRYVEMETDALALIVSRPKDSFGYFLSAIARFEQEKYEPALRDIEKALKLVGDDTNRHAELLDLRCRTRLALEQHELAIAEAQSAIQELPFALSFPFHEFCAYTALGRYEQASAVYNQIAGLGAETITEFQQRSMKYVFDTLATGRNWHPPESRPEGAPFFQMHEADTDYKQHAVKGRRLITKGYQADWSPDGTKLVYCSGAIGASGLAIYDFRTGQSELLIVPARDPRWSPDGRYITFVRDRQVLDMAVLASIAPRRLSEPQTKEIWIMRPDGTEARRLVAGTWSSWSPDGEYVFYRSSTANELCKIAAHDRTARPAFIWNTTNSWPSVSPDGRYVAMVTINTRLWIFDIEGSSGRPLHLCDIPDSMFWGCMWSPSGRWLSLCGYRWEKRNGMWIYDTKQRQARKFFSGLECPARWSPDEKSLVYTIEPPILEIWTVDIESLGPGKTFAEHDREMAAYHTRMIRAWPQQPEHYLSRAKCYSRLNEHEKVIADIEQACCISGHLGKTAHWLTRLKAAHETGTSLSNREIRGSTSYDSATDTYSIIGSGFDIWAFADDFRYTYATLDGDGSITARVESVEHVNNWTKAGVMIRSSLDPGSQHGNLLITPKGNIRFQWREREAGMTRDRGSGAGNVALPHWLRFTRTGNLFTPQHSSDGTTWKDFVDNKDPNAPMSFEIPMNRAVHIGLSITSHDPTYDAEARISNVKMTGSITPTGPFTASQDIRLTMKESPRDKR